MTKLSFEFFKAQLSGAQKEKLDSFLNSPLYYMITGRKGAQLYQDQHSMLVVCQHPHIDDRLMVFPEIGKGDYELTASVLNMIDCPQGGIQLARHTEKEINKIQGHISKLSYSKVSDISVIDENIMDWRYPAHILDTGTVAKIEGSSFVKIRNKFKKAEQAVQCVPFEKGNEIRFMKAALKFWEGNMIFNQKDTPDMSEFYNEFFDIIDDQPESFDGLFYVQGRKPVGFSVWDKTNADTSNLFINLGDSSITGLSDFQMVSACRKLAEEGVKNLNTGGSEIESLDSFKSKFKPVESLDILSAEVTFKTQQNPNIKVHRIV